MIYTTLLTSRLLHYFYCNTILYFLSVLTNIRKATWAQKYAQVNNITAGQQRHVT